ncbi:hypothetical protein HYH02_008440 [Chlamydomonas schloesseri]|uniref:Uncharacterized protein n=1 Tax=Chlamydomonas schloesseri TaxID=2026947 RepID=A0A835WFL1_9CHLO|nr:hypothetical protein HYH02_008440 [Chlamydomonas schloesseri]|eukprot:KAG2446448.1 hypothetical protein HYH02_008440 [Chlamydomonas schloesseri]
MHARSVIAVAVTAAAAGCVAIVAWASKRKPRSYRIVEDRDGSDASTFKGLGLTVKPKPFSFRRRITIVNDTGKALGLMLGEWRKGRVTTQLTAKVTAPTPAGAVGVEGTRMFEFRDDNTIQEIVMEAGDKPIEVYGSKDSAQGLSVTAYVLAAARPGGRGNTYFKNVKVPFRRSITVFGDALLEPLPSTAAAAAAAGAAP